MFKSCGKVISAGETAQQQSNQLNIMAKTKNTSGVKMFDPENPEGFVNGKEFSPEFDMIRGTEGLNCGSDENDSLMALLKEYGY